MIYNYIDLILIEIKIKIIILYIYICSIIGCLKKGGGCMFQLCRLPGPWSSSFTASRPFGTGPSAFVVTEKSQTSRS